jgi:hypothetical protein
MFIRRDNAVMAKLVIRSTDSHALKGKLMIQMNVEARPQYNTDVESC